MGTHSMSTYVCIIAGRSIICAWAQTQHTYICIHLFKPQIIIMCVSEMLKNKTFSSVWERERERKKRRWNASLPYWTVTMNTKSNLKSNRIESNGSESIRSTYSINGERESRKLNLQQQSKSHTRAHTTAKSRVEEEEGARYVVKCTLPRMI